MSQTQINGSSQIQEGTITNVQLSSNAGIEDSQLASVYLYANGSRALTGNLQGGSHVAQGFANPSASTDLATKGYVDSVAAGISDRHSALCATTGAESFTISSGVVSAINDATVDGTSLIVGAYILVKDAPVTSGTGSPDSSNPANGLYQISGGSGSTWQLTLDNSFSTNPSGVAVFVESGTHNGATGWIVTSPAPEAAYTQGTTAVQWTQISAAMQYTTDDTLTLNGTTLSRDAITGDISIPAGSNTATIEPASVTFAMLDPSTIETSSNGISSSSTDEEIPTSKAVYSYVTSAMAGAGAGTVTTVSVASANGFEGSVSNSSSTPQITLSTTVSGLIKGSSGALVTADAGTDYLAPANYVVRAQPSGTPNGSTTTFTLPSTPISGTEMVFLNGVLQETGASNDYTISGSTITFNSAPDSQSSIYATYFKA